MLFWKLTVLSAGPVRQLIILFSLAFYAIMIGNILTSETILIGLVNNGYNAVLFGFIGRVIKILALFVMFIVIGQLPIFLEVNWRENLIELYIVHGTIISFPIYHQKFQENEQIAGQDPNQDLSEDLVAGGMTGITAMLKEISQSKSDLQVIDHGDMKILLEHGQFLFVVLTMREEMHICREKMHLLCANIERLFATTLQNWDGNMSFWELASKYRERIFLNVIFREKHFTLTYGKRKNNCLDLYNR